jgi:hypothetical protein
MATLAELRQANDQIETQLRGWMALRRERGEDPQDWAAFRRHVMAIGGPDPGESAPEELSGWASGGSRATSASPTAYNPGGKAISEVNSLSGSGAGVSAGDTATWPPAAGAGSETSFWPQKKVEQ